jgi:hypothetical protein
VSEFAGLRNAELAIASFKSPLSRVEISKGIRRQKCHLEALRYIRDCRLIRVEPIKQMSVDIAKGKIKYTPSV